MIQCVCVWRLTVVFQRCGSGDQDEEEKRHKPEAHAEQLWENTFLLVTSGVFIYALIFINLNQFYFGIIEIRLQFSLIRFSSYVFRFHRNFVVLVILTFFKNMSIVFFIYFIFISRHADKSIYIYIYIETTI